MPFRLQLRFWIGALVVTIALLWLLRGILLPFVAGIALAYFLNPIVERLSRLGIARTPSSLLIVGVFLLVIVMFLLVLLPLLGSQLAEFITKLPSYVTRLQGLVTDENRDWINHFFGDRVPDIQRSLADLMSQGVSYLLGLISSIWSGGQALLSVFSLVVVTPVVVFYVLCDWPAMVNAVDSWIPLHQRPVVRRLGREMDLAVAGFIRGQALVCLLLGTFYAVALSMAGLNFGLLIGIASGLITFIPYVGSLTGLVLAMGVAIVQFFPDWTMIGIILGIFVTGQTIEGYILSPKLVGDSIGVHPVWLMFSLFAFGYLFGFVGLLLAVPLTAAAGVLVRFGFRQYFHSPLYTGAEQTETPEDGVPERR
ncbi:MAG: AI-2E family transporter [Azorhizobium sp. 32-67-21]|nr:MAG: AI-2E family transporter [Rhizobiales bacterium 12-68-15]OYX88636.1 MAG: AI-2E family transporter [Xanthobacter sp. 35-67-6]OYX88996.1 MAG: AI-2E family transporter [Azorhizobium sp. 32-67-21]